MANEERIAALKAKLAARENRPGFKANVDELKALVARLEEEDADDGA